MHEGGSILVKWSSINIGNKTRYSKGGIYRIRACEIASGKSVRIPRLRYYDEEGILMIGRTKNIERRRKQFVRSSLGNHGHSEGIQWWLVKHFSRLGEEFSLVFDFIKVEDAEATDLERKKIQEYFKKHLELPPLNSIMPRRNEWFDQLRLTK